MNNFPCPNCPKVLTSKRNLKKHLERKVPCDKVCRICKYKASDIYQYSKHQKKEHANSLVLVPKDNDDKDEIVELQPIPSQQQQIDFIPIEDFNWEYLESIASKIEVTETYYDTISHSKGKDGKDSVERIQGYERRTKLTLRAENARRCLPDCVLSNILHCLCNRFCDLPEMMYKLLHDVHGQRTEPRLLTLRGNDINRKNVNIYSRPPPSDECYWITNSNSVALKKTRDHCESLFNFALVSAIDSLFPAIQLREDGNPIIWLVCSKEISGTDMHKAFTLNKDRDNEDYLYESELRLKDVIRIDNKSNDNEGYLRFRDRIMAEIEENKKDILERLTTVQLDDKRLNEFFELAKDASTGIVPEIQ